MISLSYSELKKKYFNDENEEKEKESTSSEKITNSSDELLIKSNVKNPVLKEFLNRLEDKYGCLLTNTGCITNNNWLSVKAITVIVSELDNEIKLKENEK